MTANPDGTIEESDEDNNSLFAVPLFGLGERMNRVGEKGFVTSNAEEKETTKGSGPFTGAILRGTSDFNRLIRLDSGVPPYPWGTPPYVFACNGQDKTGDCSSEQESWMKEEDRLAQPSLLGPTTNLVGLINDDRSRISDWEQTKFSINEAYDSTRGHKDPESLHYEGRALDLESIISSGAWMLSRFAGLAWLAGFDWVWFENSTHVHVSERASFATTVSPQSFAQAVETARSLGVIDNAGIANSLLQKLDNLNAALTRGNVAAASGILKALKNSLAAQRNKHIKAYFVDLFVLDIDILARQFDIFP